MKTGFYGFHNIYQLEGGLALLVLVQLLSCSGFQPIFLDYTLSRVTEQGYTFTNWVSPQAREYVNQSNNF